MLYYKVIIGSENLTISIEETEELISGPSLSTYTKFFDNKSEATSFFEEIEVFLLNKKLLDLAFIHRYHDWHHNERKVLRKTEKEMFHKIFSENIDIKYSKLKKIYSLITEKDLPQDILVLKDIFKVSCDYNKVDLYLSIVNNPLNSNELINEALLKEENDKEKKFSEFDYLLER